MQSSRKDKKKVIPDTSIWIEYFNQPQSDHGRWLETLIKEDKVVMVGVILSELLQGTRTRKELEAVRDALITLPFLREDTYIWEEVGRLVFNLRKKGVIIPLTDCLIAVHAIRNGYAIFTLDEHLSRIPGIQLFVK